MFFLKVRMSDKTKQKLEWNEIVWKQMAWEKEGNYGRVEQNTWQCPCYTRNPLIKVSASCTGNSLFWFFFYQETSIQKYLFFY